MFAENKPESDDDTKFYKHFVGLSRKITNVLRNVSSLCARDLEMIIFGFYDYRSDLDSVLTASNE